MTKRQWLSRISLIIFAFSFPIHVTCWMYLVYLNKAMAMDMPASEQTWILPSSEWIENIRQIDLVAVLVAAIFGGIYFGLKVIDHFKKNNEHHPPS